MEIHSVAFRILLLFYISCNIWPTSHANNDTKLLNLQPLPEFQEDVWADDTTRHQQNQRNQSGLLAELKPMDAFLVKTSKGRESVLSSLLELNADLENEKEATNVENSSVHKTEVPQTIDISNLLNEVNFLPLVKRKFPVPKFELSNDASLLKFIDSLRGDAWSHFKAIALKYISSYGSEELNLKDSFILKLLSKSLDVGDNINIIHFLGRKVDPEMFDFMKDKLLPLVEMVQPFSNYSSLGNISTSFPSLNDMVNDVAWLTLKHIIHNLLNKMDPVFSKEDMRNYVAELSETNPFAAKGLLFALNMPEKRPEYHDDRQGRSFRLSDSSVKRDRKYDSLRGSNYKSRSDRLRDILDLDRDDSYGHHHESDYGHHESYGYDHKDVGYGHGGGYMSKGIYLDPYLILAGIGAAALLAYVAFRLLTTTAIGRKKREVEGPMDVETTFAILNHIENGKESYENDFKLEAADFVDGVNELWSKRSSDSCLKCSLASYMRIEYSSSLRLLLLSAVSQLLGANKTGQFMDQIARKLLDGKQYVCENKNEDCRLGKL